MIRNRYNYLIPSIQYAKGKEWRTYSNGTTIKTLREESQKDNSFPPKISQTAIQNKNFIRTSCMQRHTITEIINHSRRSALDRSVKTLLGVFNRFYVATTLALSSAVVYTRHLFSPREGFLTHQRNISENIKIKRIQRWNNDEDTEWLELSMSRKKIHGPKDVWAIEVRLYFELFRQIL